ncbi:MAG: hypothetical protein JWN15_1149 [Firmicutes bacterium]|nr:hypothetical protein [Bacillota bacterium]
MAIPGLGQIVTVALAAILLVNLTIYAAYLIAAEELPVMTAIGTGLKFIVQRPRETCLGALTLVVFGASFLLTVVIGIIPLLGQLVALVLGMVFWPLLGDYFAERFETRR